MNSIQLQTPGISMGGELTLQEKFRWHQEYYKRGDRVSCSNCRHYNEEKDPVCTSIWMGDAVKTKMISRNGEKCFHFRSQDIYENMNFGKINIPEFNLISAVIKLIAWVVMIGVFVYGTMKASEFAEFSWTVAGTHWSIGFFAAMMLFGFGEIIKLLASIDRKLPKL